ncbi:MAG: thioesterase family protein [candidate division WOR-3 bacterium]
MGKPIEVKEDVRYADLDTLGHVNNAVYLSYFEHARVKMFAEYYQKYGNFHFVIAHAEVDYIKPIYLETITIRAWVSRIGKTSFTIDYEIYNEKGELCAQGKTVQVGYDPEKKTKREIEGEFLRYIERYYV